MANATGKDVHLTIADKKIGAVDIRKYFITVPTYFLYDIFRGRRPLVFKSNPGGLEQFFSIFC